MPTPKLLGVVPTMCMLVFSVLNIGPVIEDVELPV